MLLWELIITKKTQKWQFLNSKEGIHSVWQPGRDFFFNCFSCKWKMFAEVRSTCFPWRKARVPVGSQNGATSLLMQNCDWIIYYDGMEVMNHVKLRRTFWTFNESASVSLTNSALEWLLLRL
jgi:hypothetical protein